MPSESSGEGARVEEMQGNANNTMKNSKDTETTARDGVLMSPRPGIFTPSEIENRPHFSYS